MQRTSDSNYERDRDNRQTREDRVSAIESPDNTYRFPGMTIPAPGAGYGFQRRVWFDMLASHCFADRRYLCPHAAADGAMVTLPLIEQEGQLNALANYYSFSYGPIIDGSPSPDTCLALMGRIAGQLRQDHDRISLYPLPDHDGTARMMRQAFASAGWIALLTDQGSNHILQLNRRDFATYWAGRPRALQTTVEHKGRTTPYCFTIHNRLTNALWQDYLTVHAASWKNAEPWPDMVRAIAEEAASRGALRFGIARAEGRPIAAQIWTIEGTTACIHKIAHNSTQDRNSPGTLLAHHMFRHMIDREKIEQIDHGTGNNACKRDWMEQERPMLRLDCFNPHKAALWLPALRTRISKLVRRPS